MTMICLDELNTVKSSRNRVLQADNLVECPVNIAAGTLEQSGTHREDTGGERNQKGGIGKKRKGG
jgi:hypothetical protein